MEECKYNIKGFLDELECEMEEGKELFSACTSELISLIPKMKKAVEKKDYEELKQLLHNIKGVAANFYIYDVQEQALAFETKLKASQNEDAEERIEALIELIYGAEREVGDFFSVLEIE